MTTEPRPPRTVLLCHHDAPLHSEGLVRWLASWSDLRGVVVIAEPARVRRRRVRRELRRVGVLRLADVLAQRAYHALAVAARDREWITARLAQLQHTYPAPPPVPTIRVATPNAAEAQRFIRDAGPDLVLALCKTILREEVFTIPPFGTWVLHPGICPEYRNAHGCFWALASDDLEKVGMSVLRIDRGIDTGPVYGYFTAPYDEVTESHNVIQHRMILDNLEGIAALFRAVLAGSALPLNTAGRASHEWGQPWLTRYLYWKRQARRRRHAGHRP